MAETKKYMRQTIQVVVNSDTHSLVTFGAQVEAVIALIQALSSDITITAVERSTPDVHELIITMA